MYFQNCLCIITIKKNKKAKTFLSNYISFSVSSSDIDKNNKREKMLVLISKCIVTDSFLPDILEFVPYKKTGDQFNSN